MSDHAAGHAAGEPGNRFLAHHFRDMDSQLATGKLGVWLFLGSEVLFFSGLFVAYGVYRANHYALFHYAHHFLDWRMGAINTVVLVTSSLTAAWSVRAAQLGDRKTLRLTLVLTLLLAGAFLVVKYFEYSHKLHNGVFWGAAYHPSEEMLAALPASLRALRPSPNAPRYNAAYSRCWARPMRWNPPHSTRSPAAGALWSRDSSSTDGQKPSNWPALPRPSPQPQRRHRRSNRNNSTRWRWRSALKRPASIACLKALFVESPPAAVYG